MDFNVSEHQHIRYNPLKGEWVLVSPHRLDRPWAGQVEDIQEEEVPEFDPDNPLCPGVVRPNGQETPVYTSTYVFDNDFPALQKNAPEPEVSQNPLFKIGGAKGVCRVICFHPKSNVSMGTMSIEEIFNVISIWIKEMVSLGKEYEWVQIFENRGAIMGCSNRHPHGQIWASSFIPNEATVKDIKQKEYYKAYGKPMLLDYVQQEIEKKERVVAMNSEWVVLVPFWATWPYETMILPRSHVRRFYDLNHDQKVSLALIMKIITTKYDNMFHTCFPYSMGWHGAPTGIHSSQKMDHWVFHGMYLPPLLRSASVKKFMVGYEMLAQPQRDLTPEKAANILRELPEEHYTLFAVPQNKKRGKSGENKTAENKRTADSNKTPDKNKQKTKGKKETPKKKK